MVVVCVLYVHSNLQFKKLIMLACGTGIAPMINLIR